ncbi:MAG: tRNA threonylcarbamoyladenosine dehydratase [Clostridiales bacterium]|nr:tRNA threonylcarbamoyladenosine dehydratase [Clostridiales bacterium]
MSVFQREINLIGEEKYQKLKGSAVAVFGLGGVGSYVAEALARAGVGKLLICDNDTVALHNINRQLYALHSTVGMPKAQVAFNRLKDINPDLQIEVKQIFFSAETLGNFDLSNYDYIADCIDTVTSKILLIQQANALGVKVISCMGTGNKLNCDFKVADIKKTKVCPLARVMRRELSKRNINCLKCVYSEEKPIINGETNEQRRIPASISYAPSVAGLMLAGEIIKDLIKQ